MSAEPIYSLEEVARRVSDILSRRLRQGDEGVAVAKLLNVIFLTRDELAELLRLKTSTIDKWLKEGRLPVRYANGDAKSEPRFVLAEILAWTLPDDDPHSAYRLLMVHASRLPRGNQLTADRKEN